MAAGSVFAQTAPPQSDLQARYKAAFEETLKKPGDPATLVRYAELAVQVGDVEGAISALERLLLMEGDQPRVKLELGALYLRLGSYEAARAYLEGARTSGRATPEIKERAGQLIAQIDSRTGKSVFSGDFFLGVRYSTNANSGPTGSVASFGANTVPDPTVTSRPDFAAVGVASIRHRYDLGRQDSGAMETDFTFYSARQFQVTQADVALVDIVTGPRTEPFDGWLDNLSVKPFMMGRWLGVHDMTSYWAWGAGLEGSMLLIEPIRGALTMFGRRREYINNLDATTNNRSSGNEITANLEFRIDLTGSMTMGINSNVSRYLAQTAPETFLEYGAGGFLTVRFHDPLGMNNRVWSATASGSVQLADYDQPDPAVDPNNRRHQLDANLGFVLAVPLDAQVSLLAQASYVRRTSNLNNYAYESFNSLIGIGWRF